METTRKCLGYGECWINGPGRRRRDSVRCHLASGLSGPVTCTPCPLPAVHLRRHHSGSAEQARRGLRRRRPGCHEEGPGAVPERHRRQVQGAGLPGLRPRSPPRPDLGLAAGAGTESHVVLEFASECLLGVREVGGGEALGRGPRQVASRAGAGLPAQGHHRGNRGHRGP